MIAIGTWLASIATLAAVLVALIPIWREANRRKAQARNLRIRISSKLTVLRPSLGAVVQANLPTPPVVLSKEEFREVVGIVGDEMRESAVLEVEEQDHLGVLLANLEMSAVLYGTNALHPDSARNIRSLIDRSIVIMGEYGLLQGTVKKPW